MARIQKSAAFFGFALDERVLRGMLLEHVQNHPDISRRVRVLVSRDGTVTVESSPFTLSEKPLCVALAKEPVGSRDTFLCHKTTRRSVYEVRRADAPDADDVLLWNEHGELTEFTIGNLVLELDGKRLTPPREAGLLNGVMRQEELEAGRITERKLYPQDLARAGKVWRINSLRGWQEVEKPLLEGVFSTLFGKLGSF